MAQTGYTAIQLYHSSTPGQQPLAANLVDGEVAINSADKRLFTKNAVAAVVELGTNPSTIAITAGSINNTPIGATTPAAGSFTTVSASGAITSNGVLTASVAAAVSYSASIENTSGTNNYSIVQIKGKGTGGGQVSLYSDANAVGGIYGDSTGVTQYVDTSTQVGKWSTAGLAVTGLISATAIYPAIKSLHTGGAYGQMMHEGENLIFDNTAGSYIFRSSTGFTEQMRLDSSGNLGLGVTPSAWGSPYKAIQLNDGALANYSNAAIELYQNSFDSGDGAWKYITTNLASRYAQVAGAHRFFTAPSGTAGNAITFTQGMTLTADPYLLIGYTTSNGAYKLQVNSQIFATSSTVATSDGRYKENVTPITGALALVESLNPVTFNWKKHAVHDFPTGTTTGFIAQEVQAALNGTPYVTNIIKANLCTLEASEYETIEITPAIAEVKDEDGNVITVAVEAVTEKKLIKEAVTEEFLGIAEGNLISLLTAAIKELKAEFDAYKEAHP